MARLEFIIYTTFANDGEERICVNGFFLKKAMNRVALRETAMAEVERVVESLVASASESRQEMASMERKIYGAMDGLKAKLLQAWVDEAKDDTSRPVCPHCKGRLRQKQQGAKTCVCVGGQVTVTRTRWWCESCGSSFFPSG